MDAEWREAYDRAIAKYGYQLLLVIQSSTPRFVYSIGNSLQHGHEVALFGAIGLDGHEVETVCNRILAQSAELGEQVNVPDIGSFTTRLVHPSWVDGVLLGIPAYLIPTHMASLPEVRQIVPVGALWTADVPDATVPWSADDIVWKWTDVPWEFDVPEESTVGMAIEVLRRTDTVVQIKRWDPDYWEAHGSTPVDIHENGCITPLMTLIGADPSCEALLQLEVGQSVWREPGGEWEFYDPRFSRWIRRLRTRRSRQRRP